jgi:flagellar basal-body rod protein FlgB
MKDMLIPNEGLLGKVMDMRLERQNLVMSNLANINIPGYKARSLEFEGELRAAVASSARGEVTRTNAAHMPTVFNAKGFNSDVAKEFKPRVIYGQDSVDLDKEMTTMAKNSLQYNALTTLVKSNFDSVQKAITEGGK